jgi:hypothetical protein
VEATGTADGVDVGAGTASAVAAVCEQARARPRIVAVSVRAVRGNSKLVATRRELVVG